MNGKYHSFPNVQGEWKARSTSYSLSTRVNYRCVWREYRLGQDSNSADALMLHGHGQDSGFQRSG